MLKNCFSAKNALIIFNPLKVSSTIEIPVKTLDFNHSINITGGLPFLRVSPDHGPAFNIAKKNISNVESLVASFDFLKKRP